MTVDNDTQPAPAAQPGGFDNDNRQAASIGDSARDYVNRLRGGDMGSLPAILGLVVLVVIFASLNDRFLTTYNMANLAVQASSIIVLAMGIVFVLLLGDIDLSAGVAGGACATITALMLIDYDWTWWLATLAGVAFGAVIGLAIGALVAFLGIPSFVVTLAFFLGAPGRAAQADRLRRLAALQRPGAARPVDQERARDGRLDSGDRHRGRLRRPVAVALPLALGQGPGPPALRPRRDPHRRPRP